MKKHVFKEHLMVDRIGNSQTDWGREFLKIGEALENTSYQKFTTKSVKFNPGFGTFLSPLLHIY